MGPRFAGSRDPLTLVPQGGQFVRIYGLFIREFTLSFYKKLCRVYLIFTVALRGMTEP